MSRVGTFFHEANVCAVVFVHGTFAGDDPLAVAKLLRAVPAVGSKLHGPLRALTKSGIDAMLGDLGTFSTSYAKLFGSAIGNCITCSRFTWSSENHHAARLEATLELTRTLATLAEHADRAHTDAPPRILCMAHSHGAQLFALLSHMLQRTPEGNAMLDVLRTRGHDLRHVRRALSVLSNVDLDVMTFGTPPRYTWADHGAMHVLHLVNKGGDVIRKLGGHGSDTPAAVVADRAKNQELGRIFGDAALAPANVLSRLRSEAEVDLHGTTYLVDYGAPSSLLAHGVYTRAFAMLVNAKIAASHFYGADDGDDASTSSANVGL
jgi:hypothetical protein